MKLIVILLALCSFKSSSFSIVSSFLVTKEGEVVDKINQENQVLKGQNEDTSSNNNLNSIDEFLPNTKSLFKQDAVDNEGLSQMDCHLRNVDFCFAGLLGGMQKVLPETDTELETRCDEMKAAMSCLTIFNKRCSSFKVLSVISPMSSFEQVMSTQQLRQVSPQLVDFELPLKLRNLILNENLTDSENNAIKSLKTADLMQLCEPAFKTTKMNQLLRRRLFDIAKCANTKIYLVNPCVEDLKVALQVFYEPGRVLPLKPSCCAISRFRECAQKALDGICGISSYAQLEQMLSSSSMGSQGLRIINRVCRQEASKFDSPYCLDLLPPVGLKAPHQRRGSKASKLAKALDLITLSQPPQASL